MGVTTRADERIESAKNHLKEAIQDLCDANNEDCWGHEDFTSEYQDKMFGVLMDIIKASRKLIP